MLHIHYDALYNILNILKFQRFQYLDGNNSSFNFCHVLTCSTTKQGIYNPINDACMWSNFWQDDYYLYTDYPN